VVDSVKSTNRGGCSRVAICGGALGVAVTALSPFSQTPAKKAAGKTETAGKIIAKVPKQIKEKLPKLAVKKLKSILKTYFPKEERNDLLLSWLGLPLDTKVKAKLPFGSKASALDKDGIFRAELTLLSGAKYHVEIIFDEIEDLYRQDGVRINEVILTPLDSKTDPELVLINKEGAGVNIIGLLNDLDKVKAKDLSVYHAVQKDDQTFFVASKKSLAEINKMFQIESNEKTEVKGLKLFHRVGLGESLEEHGIMVIDRAEASYPETDNKMETRLRYFARYGESFKVFRMISSQRDSKVGDADREVIVAELRDR